MGHAGLHILKIFLALCFCAGLSGTLHAQDWVKLDLKTPFAAAYFVPDEETIEFHGEIVLPYGEAHMTGPEGMAHYLEHLVAFSAYPKNDGERFQNDFNATTSNTRTNYYMNSADPNYVLEYLSGVFRPIHLDDGYADSEQSVVLREYHVRYGENPEAQAWNRFERMFYKGSSLSRSTIGTPKSIMALKADDAKAIHESHYIIEAATLVVRANMTADEVSELIDNAFSGLASGAKVPSSAIKPPVRKKLTLNEPIKKLQRENSTFKTILPWDAHPNWAEVAHIANTVISSAKKSGLHRKLVFDENTLDDFYCGSFLYAHAGIIEQYCWGRAKRRKPLLDLREAIVTWRSELRSDDPDFLETIDESREFLIRSLQDMDAEDDYRVLLQMIRAGQRDFMDKSEYINALNAVTPEDILAYFDAVIESDTYATLNLLKRE